MAASIIQMLTIYAAIGGVVAVVFLLFGIDRVDPSAHGSFLFRPMIAPGVVILWPIVLIRWLQLERARP